MPQRLMSNKQPASASTFQSENGVSTPAGARATGVAPGVRPIPKSSDIMPASLKAPLVSGVPADSSEISSSAMICELSFSSSPSSSPSGVSWKSPTLDSGPTLMASGSSETSSSETELPMPRSSDEPMGAEPLKSSGTSSSARPLSDGEMILMPLLSPESVTSLPSPRTWSSSSSSSAERPVSAPLDPSLPPRLISEPS